MKTISKFGIMALGILIISLIGVYVFYILYHAEWLIGDDAFMLRRTAFGIPFPFSESILPTTGFLRPFDYLHENFVLLFHSGMHNAFEHYIINAVSFMLCMGALAGILWKTVKPKDLCDYAIVVFGVIVVASRLIGVYINIFGPIFGVYTYHMLAIFFLSVFIENDKIWAMVLSLFCWLYSMLIYENVCMVLGCMGVFPLLFVYKRLNIRYRVYCYTLIAMALAFVVAYIIIYMPTRGMVHYDPAHNSGMSMLENAKNILMGQKFIWVAVLVWLFRQIQLLQKKVTYHVLYDTLLWAAGGMVIGAVVLRLNWTMYYYDAIILSLPAVVYFLYISHEKYGKYLVLGTTLLFAAWHSVNVPRTIRTNQKDRIETSSIMQKIAHLEADGWTILWFDGKKLDDVSEDRKVWRKGATRSYMQYLMKDKNWDFDKEINEPCVVFNSKENENIGVKPSFVFGHSSTYIGVSSGVCYYIIQ